MKSRRFKLYDHQEKAIDQLKTGSILCGGVGSGKSITAIAYYLKNEHPKDLYIITTAAKRDTLDWEKEASLFDDVKLTVDSWNNIKKYTKVEHAFFVFDEQRVVGSGAWVRSFLKITKLNNWILLSATPGDTWMDYIPVFVANGFYKNRTDFVRSHVVFARYVRYPKIQRYIEESKLLRLKNKVLVLMNYEKKTIPHKEDIIVEYDEDKFKTVIKKRWNPYEDRPIKDAGELFLLMRKIVNTDSTRLTAVRELFIKHGKIIVFYNFNYELELLRELKAITTVTEYNGHKHEDISDKNKWIHLVQYIAGSEGWNCTQTNVVVFYSLNYSYKIMTQAAGRIDRLTTPFVNLYYYYILSNSLIDKAVYNALKKKKNFNERRFLDSHN